MSHSIKINGTVFFYNSDFSGDIDINHNGASVTIPFETLKDFVAEYVRDELISRLENESSDNLLFGHFKK
jgi:hypothetical protein